MGMINTETLHGTSFKRILYYGLSIYSTRIFLAKIMQAERVTYISVFKLWFTFRASPSATAP